MTAKFTFVVTLSLIVTLPLLAEEQKPETTPPASAEKKTDDMAEAEDPGLPFLEQALEEKLKSNDIKDIGRVIALAQRARKEGLSKKNLQFCDELIASEQLYRGLTLSEALVGKSTEQLGNNWQVVRNRILNDLESAVRVLKNQPLALLRIAQLNMLPEGNTKRAEEVLKQLEPMANNNPEVFLQVQMLKALAEKDPEKREKIIEDAAKENPSPHMLLLLVKSQIGLRQYEKAAENLKKILELDPDNVQALVGLYEVLSETGENEEALKVLSMLEEAAPNPRLAFEKARLFNRLGKNKEAIEVLNQLREKDPKDPGVLGLRAAIHLEMKDYANAMKDTDAALRLVPEGAKAKLPMYLLKVQIFVAQKKMDEAIQFLEELTKNISGSKELEVLLVQLYTDKKEYDKAEALLKKLAEKNPENNYSFIVLQAGLLAEQKKSREALKVLNEVLDQKKATKKETVMLLRLKGNLLLNINRHSDAVAVLEEVLKQEPDDEVSLNNLSWLLSTSPIDIVRNGQRALELAKKACELTDYKKSYILSTLAAAYAELGDFEKAMEWSQKSIDVSQEDDNVKDRVDDLKKELESYKKRQPFREALEEK